MENGKVKIKEKGDESRITKSKNHKQFLTYLMVN